MNNNKISAFNRLLAVLRFQRKEISAIYAYAIFSGLVALTLPLGIQSIIGFVMGGAISVSLIVLICLVIAGVFISGLLKVNQMKVVERVQQQLFVRYAFEYTATIPQLNMLYINKYSLPELSNRFFDVVSLQKSISKLLLEIPAASIQIIFGLVLLSFYHPFFISFGILLLLGLLLVIRYTGNRGFNTSMQVSDFKYKTANYIQELSRTIFNLKFTRHPEWTLRKADDHVYGYLMARTAHFKVLTVQYWTLIIFKVVIVSSMLIVGAYLLINQQLNIGQFIATEIVIMSIIESIEKLILNLDKVYDTLTSVEKINKLTDLKKETPGNTQLEISTPPSIKISALSFGFKDGKNILKDVNIEIGAGDKVCITGKTGSGKSTLLKLVSGLYELQEGNIFINQSPIGNYDPNVLRNGIGIMSGTQELFEGSIRDNICTGDTTITEQELYRLADLTGLRSYIDDYQNGFEHRIIPANHQLPEIILRKILLARALVHRPPLLLLENPWQGMEEAYANRIKEYLLTGMPHTTVLVVTNDSGFAARCTKRIQLDSGKATLM